MKINQYTLRVRHDKGTTTILTTAESPEDAIRKVMVAEGCPERAIISCKKS